MSSVETLKQFVNDRLAAAAQEIFGVFQLTVSELESELVRQRKLLNELLKQPVVRLPNIDIQQQEVIKQEDSPERECRSSLDLEEPEEPHNEDEKQENNALVQTNRDEAQREEEPPTSSLTQNFKKEHDGDNCGSEPASHLNILLHPDHQRPLSSKSDTDNNEDWRKTCYTQPGSNSVENTKVDVSEKKNDADLCSGCGTKCSLKTGVSQHLKSHCGSLTCSFCCNSFENNLEIHSGERPFSCSLCGKCFTYSERLKNHMRIHTGEKPFSCSLCGKCFTQSGNLKYHMKIHTGEKPFTCSQCCQGFNHRGNLQKHMKVHTGEKPFSCSLCCKCFAFKGSLKHHMKIHTGEKPFGCSYCGKCFIQRGNLNDHMRIHTGEKPFSCPHCDKHFAQRGNLRTHMKKFHTG